jgi:hypothetical protein
MKLGLANYSASILLLNPHQRKTKQTGCENSKKKDRYLRKALEE